MKNRSFLTPPVGVELFETPISIHWMGEPGIMFVASKPVEHTLEYYMEVIQVYSRLVTGGIKLCMLADATNSMPMSKEIQNFVAAETPKYIKAMAIVTGTPFENTRTKTFLKLAFAGFPIQMFRTKDDALIWLREFL